MIIYTAAAGSCGSGRYVSILRVQFKRGGWRALGPHGSHPHRLLIDPHVLWRDHGRLDTKYTVILVRISWFPGRWKGERGRRSNSVFDFQSKMYCFHSCTYHCASSLLTNSDVSSTSPPSHATHAVLWTWA